MNAYFVCQQKFYADGKTKQGCIKYLTIDGGWSEIIEYAAIHKENHAKYISEKHQKGFRDYRASFFIKEVKDD